ncbi:MAG: AAA family ATPase [Candidatus Lokiarchaeota archaeon]|nr:AAA family ATPase [Candidatus Lokiarchaeota archaeon]
MSFSGKGGVGKSTLLIMLLKHVLNTKKYKNILVIDADPDANVADIIGEEIRFKETVGGKMTELKEKIAKRQIPLDVPKNQIIESEVFDAIIEKDEFDIIEMGRSEGEGCYCSVNNTLKQVIDVIAKNYDLVLIDAPAGLEYFARKTGRNVTDLVIVTDASKMGLHTMERIIEVSKEVNLKFEKIWILGNKFPSDTESVLKDRVEKIGDNRVEFLGVVPYDDEISKFNLVGKNLLKISNNAQLYKSISELYEKVL